MYHIFSQWWSVGSNMGPAYWGLKKQMGCLCLQAKLLRYVTIHLISLSLPRKRGSSQTIHRYISLIGLIGWLYMKHFGCHDVLILGTSPIKWRQRPDMIIAVDWGTKPQLEQTNMYSLFSSRPPSRLHT